MDAKGYVRRGNFYKLPLVHIAGQNGDGTYRQALLNSLKTGEQLKIRYYSDCGVMRVGVYTMEGSALGDLPDDFAQEIIRKIQRYGAPVVRVALIEGAGKDTNKGLVVTLSFH